MDVASPEGGNKGGRMHSSGVFNNNSVLIGCVLVQKIGCNSSRGIAERYRIDDGNYRLNCLARLLLIGKSRLV